MRSGVLVAVLILAGAFSACAAYAGPKEDLLATDKAYSDMSVAKGTNAATLFYLADDGRLFGTGNYPPIYGKAAMVKRLAEQSDANTQLSWTPEHAGLSDDGTTGWTDGARVFLGPPNDKGERPKATGHYLTVWKKDANGQWKTEAVTGTTDCVPAAP